MIRVPDLKCPPQLRVSWDRAIAPLAKVALADFARWPLFENAGEPWPDVPPRYTRITTASGVAKAIRSDENDRLTKAVNPGLREIYTNLSSLLNARHDHFQKVWEKLVEKQVNSASRRALREQSKRRGWKLDGDDEGYWEYRGSIALRSYAWEQLHRDAVEEPFEHHNLVILRAGHVPAGLKGADWKTCQILYF